MTPGQRPYTLEYDARILACAEAVEELPCYKLTIEEIWEAYKTKYDVHDGGDLCSEAGRD